MRLGINLVAIRNVAVGLSLTLLATVLFLPSKAATTKTTDFEAELNQTGKDIAELKDGATTGLLDVEKATRFVYRLYHKASLTANANDFQTAESAIKSAIQTIGPSKDLCLLKANLDFKFHRLAETKSDLEMVADLANRPEGQEMQADLDLQEGRYQAARKGYKDVIQKDPTWGDFARLAYLESKIGDATLADQLYAEAEDEITAKEMRSYAWVELQRGLLDLTHGRYQSSLTHYKRANSAYSGYWLVDEHIAELLGAQGNFNEAAALYQQVIARAPRPEVEQALGDLYLFMGKPDLAKAWHAKALAGYLESTQRGEVQYFHHLAGFYADAQENGPEAVKWAYKDLALRQNFGSYDALAWALYRTGLFSEALEAMRAGLSSGVQDAHIFFHAGMIYTSAGRASEGREFLVKAGQINPHYTAFHVHR